MLNDQKIEKFRQIVENKFQIYNSLFMSLPYDKMTNIGMLLPFLYEESKEGYEQGKSPEVIIEEFFQKHTNLESEEQKLELLFKIIQYVERQVVLFDSIEDAAFQQLHSESDTGTILNLHERATQEHHLEELRKKMRDFAIKIVFTAHPTQFYPNSVQRIIHDLRDAIINDSVTQIDALLQQLGKTPFVNKERPTPLDEAMSIIYYLRYVYYQSIGELYKKIKQVFGTEHFTPHPDIIKLGFWPGGDRDGNPFVTADITLKVAEELRISILKDYYGHLKNVRRKLSFRGVSDVLEKLSKHLYSSIFQPDVKISSEDIINQINQAEKILIEQHNGLFRDVLDDYRDRVKIFGTHFATLDIRQDSRIHQNIINEIYEKISGNSASEKTPNELIDYLLKVDTILDPLDFENEITQETLKSIINIKTIQAKNGERGMHRYIISNSDEVKDVMNVFVMMKLCGYSEEEIKMDIVPLFETMEGLENSEEVMRKLYSDEVYKNHLKRRNNQQFIMLGFSDGTKDGGYLKANWEIIQVKKDFQRSRLRTMSRSYSSMVEVGHQQEVVVKPTIFTHLRENQLQIIKSN